MTTKNTGGPAFPIPLNPGQSYQGHAPCDGMTLRDYFAAKVIQGICASGPGNSWTNARLAKEAYAMADAMLEVRENKL